VPLALDELPVLPVALALAVLPAVLEAVAAVEVFAEVEPLAPVEPLAGEEAAALVLPERAFAMSAIVVATAVANAGVVLADVAEVEGAAGAEAVVVGALEDVDGPDCEAGRASLLVATTVRLPAWSTVVVFVPLSTRVTVSPPFVVTVTCGPCTPPPREMFEPVPENLSTVLPVASFETHMVVRPFSSSTRVVFVPSSTRVTVSLPKCITETAGAGVDDAAGVAAGVGVDGVAAGAGVGVDGAAAGAGVDAAAGVVAVVVGVAGTVVEGRAGGGVGSAAAVPAGFAALAPPPAAPERLCRSCGRSLSASVR
jgi:hypothetical protein